MATHKSTLSSTGTEGTPEGLGARYVSIAAWESAAQANHSLGDISILEIYKGTSTNGNWDNNGHLNEQLILDGFTVQALGDVVIEPAANNEHGGVVGDGFRLYSAGQTIITFELRQTGTIVKGIEVSKTGTSATVPAIRTYADVVIVEQCIFSILDPSIGGAALYLATTDDSIIKSNLIYSESLTDGCAVLDTRANRTQIFGNTFIHTQGGNCIGFAATSSVDVDLVGNVFRGDLPSVTWDSVNHTQSHNGFAGSGSFGTSPYAVIDNDFEDYANGDYRAKAGGAIENAGLAWAGLTTDINGNARNDPPEGGAYEITAAVTPAVLSTPTTTDITASSVTIGCTSDTAGGTLYWYVSTSATPPSSADLKSGTGAVASGNLVPIAGANTASATGLSGSTTYYHHWIQDNGADSNILTSASFDTLAPALPVLSLPTTANITETTATIGCTTDTAGGTLYWYVSTSATPPSIANLKSGSGATAFGNLVPSLGANTAGATGLTGSTTYYHHWVQETTGDSNVLTSASFETDPAIVAPTVEAGGPYSGNVSSAIQLNGSVTPGSDASPTILWTIVSGGTGTFSNDAIENPTFTPDQTGAYVLRLSADPSDGPAVTDDANLTSNAVAIPPSDVEAGGPYSGDVGVATQVTGSFTAGTDPDPTITWSINSGGTGTFSDIGILNPTFTPDNVGVYELNFEVNPSDEFPVADTASFTANAVAPTVDANGPYAGSVGTATPLSATVTPGSDPSPVITWSIDSGGTGTFSDPNIANPTFTPDVIGAYVLRVSVNPSDGSPVEDTANFDSLAVAPTVEAGGPYSGVVSTAIPLDATVTPGSDGSPTLSWSIVSGGTGTFSDSAVEDPTFTPDAVALYTLRLTVDPSDGSPVSDDASLNATAAPTAPSNVDAGGPYTGDILSAIAISATYNPGTGANLTLLWQADRPGTFGDATAADTTFTPSETGAYVLTFTATNDVGSDNDTASLTSNVATVPVQFDGPDIADINGVVGQAITPIDISGLFSGTATPFTFAETGTSWPVTAALDPNTGIITWTPNTEATTAGHSVTATDDDSATAASNLFSFIAVLPSGPVITSQPGDVTVVEGDNATFTVTATGEAPLTYQWLDETSTSIPGATSATYVRSTVAADDGKTFRCIVTDAFDQSTSSESATLTVQAVIRRVGVVPSRTGNVNVAFSFNVSPYYQGDLTPFTYTSLNFPWNGLTLNSSTGVISGVPVDDLTLSGIVVTATDAGANTANSNTFSITISPQDEIPLASVGNWTGEYTTTVGIGDLILTGPVEGPYTTFASIGETRFWYAIVDGDNREAGIGTLVNEITFTRDIVYSILQDGQYFNDGTKLPLTGAAQIYSTFNKVAFDLMMQSGDLAHAREHLLYGPDHTDVDESQPLETNQVLGYNGTSFVNDYRADIVEVSAGKTYYPQQVAESEGWLMSCLVETDDSPAPEPEGPEQSIYTAVPTWTVSQHTGHVYSVLEVTVPATDLWAVVVLEVWTQDVTADDHYQVLIRDGATGAFEELLRFDGNASGAQQFFNVPIAANFLPQGGVFTVWLHQWNSSSTTDQTHPWTRQANTNQNVDPGPGNWSANNQITVLRINETDGNAINQSVLLNDDALIGSRVRIQDKADADAWMEVNIGSIADQGAYVIYDVAGLTTGPSGQPTVLDSCDITFEVPVLGVTNYVTASNHLSPYPTLQSLIALDDPDTGTPNQDGVGINMTFQEYYLSPDWKFLAYSGGTLSSSGAGGLAPHVLTYHDDVVLATPVDGQILVFDGTNWVNLERIEGVVGGKFRILSRTDYDALGPGRDGSKIFFIMDDPWP